MFELNKIQIKYKFEFKLKGNMANRNHSGFVSNAYDGLHQNASGSRSHNVIDHTELNAIIDTLLDARHNI